MFSSKILASFDEAKLVVQKFLDNKNNLELISLFSQKIYQTIKRGNKVLSCGNGGSMCDAMHFAEELTGRFKEDRKSLAAISISDPSHISCVANDYGFEYIFSRYVEGVGSSGDLLLGISTSGNSDNIVNAVKMAKTKQIESFCLLGNNGGKLKSIADNSIIVQSNSSARVQEVHIKIIHIAIEIVESFFKK